jgi:glutamate N-acetyltransferase/amino-acid acetyltransferase
MKYIDGGICAAKGFKASGTYCGIKKPNVENFDPQIKHKNDICLFTSDVLCNAAAVYTQNKVKGAPILVTKANLEKSGNKAIAVIANSKNANTCNADGVEKADKMCELVANELNIPKEQVIVASTGVIGQVLPIEPIEKAVPILVKELDYGKNEEASTAIMTTDTIKKEYAVEFEIGGVKCTLGGMAKGSGMIHPNMATTLNFITSDCAVSSNMLQKALSEIVKVTYNFLCVVNSVCNVTRHNRLINFNHCITEHLPVLSLVYSLGVCSQKLNSHFVKVSVFCKLHTDCKTCLTAKTAKYGIGAFLFNDSFNRFFRKRLKIYVVGKRFISHNGCRV